ncbi:MAG: hypothetical protein HY424_01710 [Candidatus Levybacteria bacterium]|nr:hypothetical protein [Candidatus Levybacteria bacterium]
MVEVPNFSKNHEKILPNQILLFAEPIFKSPTLDASKETKFRIPLGVEAWVEQLADLLSQEKLTQEKLTEAFGKEYLSILSALKEMNVPFRIIIAHRKAMDEGITFTILRDFNVKSLGLHEAISETCFPRDMLVDFDGQIFINPRANFKFTDNSGITSSLGEGGRVLKLGKKVFVPDPREFVQPKSQYVNDLNSLSNRFQFGYLPYPLTREIDIKSKTNRIFPNDHLDRVAAFIKGGDGGEYLLLDGNYVAESRFPYGKYWPKINAECQKLNVNPVVVDRKPDSIPYALNLEQFADGSVLLTGGDHSLAKIIKELVGDNKTYTTRLPIVFYPLFRRGGIRCMFLHAPQKILGKP